MENIFGYMYPVLYLGLFVWNLKENQWSWSQSLECNVVRLIGIGLAGGLVFFVLSTVYIFIGCEFHAAVVRRDLEGATEANYDQNADTNMDQMELQRRAVTVRKLTAILFTLAQVGTVVAASIDFVVHPDQIALPIHDLCSSVFPFLMPNIFMVFLALIQIVCAVGAQWMVHFHCAPRIRRGGVGQALLQVAAMTSLQDALASDDCELVAAALREGEECGLREWQRPCQLMAQAQALLKRQEMQAKAREALTAALAATASEGASIEEGQLDQSASAQG